MTNYGSPPAAQPLSASDEKLWSTLAHVGNVIGFLPSLLIFLILGPRSAQVRSESRKALNFVITASIAGLALFILGRIVDFMYAQTPTGLDLIFLLLGGLIGLVQFAVWIVVVILSIINAVHVNRGEASRYPFSLNLVK